VFSLIKVVEHIYRFFDFLLSRKFDYNLFAIEMQNKMGMLLAVYFSIYHWVVLRGENKIKLQYIKMHRKKDQITNVLIETLFLHLRLWKKGMFFTNCGVKYYKETRLRQSEFSCIVNPNNLLRERSSFPTEQ